MSFTPAASYDIITNILKNNSVFVKVATKITGELI